VWIAAAPDGFRKPCPKQRNVQIVEVIIAGMFRTSMKFKMDDFGVRKVEFETKLAALPEKDPIIVTLRWQRLIALR
jgi:hypothetical protein